MSAPEGTRKGVASSEAPRPLADLFDDNTIWAIIEGAPDGTVVCDSEGRIVLVNEEAEHLFGYARAELLGHPVERLLPVPLRGQHLASRTRFTEVPVRRGMGKGLELLALHRSGAEFPVEIALSPAYVGGQVLVVASVRDIGERQRAQRESEATKIRAAEVAALVDERDRMARELHDTVIQRLFAAGLSLQATAAAVADAPAQRILDAIDGIDAAIRELRMAIFAMSGSRQHVSDTGVQRAIRQIANEAARLLPDRPTVSFHGPVDSAVTEALRRDLVAVTREALSNIVRHARAKVVNVDLSVADGMVILTITDDGVGLPAKVDSGGHGLANLIERAQRQGGECTFSTSPSGGTTIRWTAPGDGAPSPRSPEPPA